MSRDFWLFTVAFGEGIVVVSSLVVGEALGEEGVAEGDDAAADDDDDESDGVEEDDADEGADELGDGDGDDDIVDDEGAGDGADGVADDGDVDEGVDDVDDGGVTSVLRWQPEEAASASAAVKTSDIDGTVMRISRCGCPRRAAPTCDD